MSDAVTYTIIVEDPGPVVAKVPFKRQNAQ